MRGVPLRWAQDGGRLKGVLWWSSDKARGEAASSTEVLGHSQGVHGNDQKKLLRVLMEGREGASLFSSIVTLLSN